MQEEKRRARAPTYLRNIQTAKSKKKSLSAGEVPG
jgi:hypothetical protein